MTAASQEMADLLREVQKLQKELQPVRSAIAALQKREAETPNPTAAGSSLHKVATRLETVRQKYEPFLTRLQELLSDEVPSYLQQTQLLAVGEDGFEGKSAADASHEAAGAAGSTILSPASPFTAAAAGRRSTNRSTTGDAAHTATAAAATALLREVCPPSTPHLLRPENVQLTQQQLRLRAEMVEYLLATDRTDIADHVARSYGLPLQWFPRLVALHRERTFGRAIDVGSVAGVHSPTGGTLHPTAPTPTASPLVTPATRPRGAGAATAPKSPMQLPPSAAPARLAASTHTAHHNSDNHDRSMTGTPTVYARSPAGGAVAGASASFTALPPPARLPQREGLSPSSTLPRPLNTRDGVGAASTTPEVSPAGAAGLSAPADAAAPLMPDLVARVVSAAMYLKDDYMDRMVLERTLEQSEGLVTPLPAASAAGAENTKSPTSAAVAQYNACVLSRIANVPRHHLHTQSGDPVFDSAMMNVIEELLVYGLQRWAEDDTNLSDAVATHNAQRGSDSSEAQAAEVKRRKAELMRTLTTDTFLTAEEMLLADKVWNEDILFLKRPTRFYCVETGLSTEELAGTEAAAPRARSTGEVVSYLSAEAQGILEQTTGIFIT